MPRKIIIVRHGETDFNVEKILQGHLDTFLNANGLDQANRVAEKLIKDEVDIILSSDSKRTYFTALTIAKKLNKKVETTFLLRERYFGKLEGMTFDEIRKVMWCFGYENAELNQLIEGRSKKFGVENNKEMQIRLKKLLNQIKKYKNKTVVLVTHGGTIRELLKLFDLSLARRINNTECFYLEKNNAGKYALIS